MCAFISKNENNLSNFQSDGKTIFNKKITGVCNKIVLKQQQKRSKHLQVFYVTQKVGLNIFYFNDILKWLRDVNETICRSEPESQIRTNVFSEKLECFILRNQRR